MSVNAHAAPSRHLWIRGTSAARREAAISRLGLPPVLCVTSAARGLRGPYTAGGSIARALVPAALHSCPDLVTRHDIELLTVAPELRATVPATRETLTSTAPPKERTRFYPGARTARVAHGLSEFVGSYARITAQGPVCLFIDRADHADETDAELLATMLRRLDPQLVRVVVGSASGSLSGQLASALETYAETVDVTDAVPDGREDDVAAAAELYVASDCTDDDPVLLAAYERLSAQDRAALHDRRADALEARDEVSLRLGAIPLHRERGSDPTGAGVAALTFAIEHCILMGFYDAVLDFGARCHALLDWNNEPMRCWLVTAKVCTALTAMGRADDAAEAYDAACASSTLPSVHLQAAYGRAMLYTRFYEGARRDHQRAKSYINTAIAISSLLPEQEQRAFNTTFNENGLALIEMHLGDLSTALRLVTAGLERVEREIGPDRQTLHRTVLRHNAAQLLVALGRDDEAMVEYGRLIAADPSHSEYYLDRAAIHRRVGDVDAALADYEQAIRMSPPYPEPHYNRADLLTELGELEEALLELDYVLDLDPGYLDAYVNRASLRYQLDDLDGCARDIEAGLALDCDQPHLHGLRGQLAADAGDLEGARASLERAVTLDPALSSAWGNLGVMAYQAGDACEAVRCLDRAIDHTAGGGDDPTLRFNRAIAREAIENWSGAVADYGAALELGGEQLDVETLGEILYRRAGCLIRLGDRTAARRDLERCRSAGGPYADRATADLAAPGLDIPAAARAVTG